MAKSYMMARRASNYRFLSNDPVLPAPTTELEFEESDVWGGSTRSDSPESPPSWRKSSRKPMGAPTPNKGRRVGDAASLPVNIPDWSKILREEYKGDNKWSFDFDNGGGYGGGGGGESGGEEEWVPPHEYLARTRMASLSVHEGVGRTLKGRDLHKVRNAIWEKTGFQD